MKREHRNRLRAGRTRSPCSRRSSTATRARWPPTSTRSADGDASPLARVPGHALRALGDHRRRRLRRAAGQRRDALKAPRLLFTSNFDGAARRLPRGAAHRLADDADAIWGHCARLPRPRRRAPRFAAYLRAHQLESALFFAAYGDQTVDAGPRQPRRAHAADRVRDGARRALDAADAARRASMETFPAMTDARPRQHPGLRRPRLPAAVRRLPVPAHRRRRRGARALLGRVHRRT